MSLLSVEAYPIPILGQLSFLWLPSRRQTEKARQALVNLKEKEFIFAAHPFTQEFAEGKFNIGTKVKIDGRLLTLEGVYPKGGYPEAMVFWDDQKKCHVQFNFLPCYAGCEIIN
jgi:hypothetical protein